MQFLRILAAVTALSTVPAQSGPVEPSVKPVAHHSCPQWMIDAELKDEAKQSSDKPDLNMVYQFLTVTEELHPFCLRRPTAVACAGHLVAGPGKLTLKQVQAIDKGLRASFTYVSDQIQYGVEDYWENGSICGDCEDYALQESERLAVAGQDGRNMELMIWRATPWGAHATLVVETSDAGDVEMGVEGGGEPAKLRIERGVRVAYTIMDGRQTYTMFAAPWSLLPPNMQPKGTRQ